VCEISNLSQSYSIILFPFWGNGYHEDDTLPLDTLADPMGYRYAEKAIQL